MTRALLSWGAPIVVPLRREIGRRLRFAVGRGLVQMGFLRVPPRTWVLGGFVGAAFGDNSAALFRYLRRERPDIHAVWAIKSGAADVDRALAVGPVVDHEGVDAAAYASAAEVLVVSHGLHDVPGFASRASRALRVRLGHGLTALKRTKPPRGRSAAATARLYDLVPVASEFERAHKLQWGIRSDQLPLCGLCRFDDLVGLARTSEPQRRILYLPTWREWLGEGAGDDDPGICAILELLGSTALRSFLHQADLSLDIIAHRLFSGRVREAILRSGGDRVRLLGRDVDVQAALARSLALVTDYSGVTWDMLYLDRPVLFFQPDVDRYERTRGAYIDLRGELPGPSARTGEELVAHLRHIHDCGYALSSTARGWQQRAFAFRDDSNCARVVSSIEAALKKRAPR